MTYWVIPLVAALVSLVLGVVVARSRRGTEVADVFVFLATTLVFWNLNFYLLYSIEDAALAFQLTRVFRVPALFLPPAIIHLSLALLRLTSTRVWRRILVFDYAVSSFLVLINAGDMFVHELRHYTWGFSTVGTRLYNIFTLSVIFNFIAACALSFIAYRRSPDPRTAIQLRFWLVGVLIALPLGLTTLLPIYGISFYPLGSLGNVAWATVVAYAIVRHRLMDIDLVVTKSVALFAVSIAFFLPVLPALVALQQWAFGEAHYDFTAILLCLFIAAGLLFPIARARLERGFERAFFPAKHQGRAALSDLARTVVGILDRERLVAEVCGRLSQLLKVEQVVVYLRGRSEGSFELQRGSRAVDGSDQAVSRAFGDWLRMETGPILTEEHRALQGSPSEALLELERRAWEVVVPLLRRDALVGFISLGRKIDNEPFTANQLELLGDIGAQATIAFENARLYEELGKSKDIIQRAGRLSAIGTLAAGVAHEIRNPLVSIQTFFQLAPQRIHDEEFVTSFLKITELEVRRICDLITELLTFARSSDRQYHYSDFGVEVERAVVLLTPEARKQRIALKYANTASRQCVLADGEQLRQVLINIILNAIQASGEGGQVRITSYNSIEREEECCVVSIVDTGEGISKELREEIFNPFFTTKAKGTGLGLAVAHQIVTEHGGFIAVDSPPTGGAEFRICIPLVSSSEVAGDDPPLQGVVVN